MRYHIVSASLLALHFYKTGVQAFLSQGQHVSPSYTRLTPFKTTSNDIEPYVGPIGSIADMEGGILVGK